MTQTTEQGGAASSVWRHPAFIISAAAAGTAFEWYDFFIYGAMASLLAKNFFAGVEPGLGYLFSLLAFSAGFAVRPFGSLLFGHIGDIWGRKNTFLVTMLLMGGATIGVGCLPTYAAIGVAAPVLLVVMRLIQGFSVGGEFGGAIVYIAEHAPDNRRGFYTSFVQATPTVGMLIALSTVLIVRTLVGEAAFAAWGWRLPFLMSAVLLAISLWIRAKLGESPEFAALTAEGGRSTNPLKDLFGSPAALARALLAFGMSGGMTVVFYTAELYTGFFLDKVLHVEGSLANALMILPLLLAMGLTIGVGRLTDSVGRKWIYVAGCLLAATLLSPLFDSLARGANPALMAATDRSPVTVRAVAKSCTQQFDLVGRAAKSTPCDVARTTLAAAGVSYRNAAVDYGATVVEVGTQGVSDLPSATFEARIKAALVSAGYPARADVKQVHVVWVMVVLTAVLALVTLTFAGLGAMLADLFPANIRYSGVGVPYNIASGWLGGFLPPIAFSLVTATGNMFAGLWYPMVITGVCGVAVALSYREHRRA